MPDITGIGSIFDFGSKIIDRIFPNKEEQDKAKLAMLQLQQQGQFKELELQAAALKAQTDINLEEAKSSNLFVSGWRPFIGWVCGSGLLYTVLGRAILISCGVTRAPEVDAGVLIELLLALLGMAGYRTFEKTKGVASK